MGLFFPLSFLLLFITLPLMAFLKSKLFWFQLVILLASMSTVLNFIGIPNTKNEAVEPSISITTYNLHGFRGFRNNHTQDHIVSGIVNFLSENRTDVICLQEFRSWSGNIDGDISTIKKKTGHAYHHFQLYWNKGGIKSDGFLILSKFPIVNTGVITASTRRNIGIYSDLLIDNDLLIKVLNVHLISFGLRSDEIDMLNEAANMEIEKIREHGKNVISKLIYSFKIRQEEMHSIKNELLKTSDLVILTGDFNETPASFTYRTIKKTGILDAHKQAGRYFGLTYAGNLPLLRIDYIFHSSKMNALETQVHEINFSDHYPLTSKIFIKSID